MRFIPAPALLLLFAGSAAAQLPFPTCPPLDRTVTLEALVSDTSGKLHGVFDEVGQFVGARQGPSETCRPSAEEEAMSAAARKERAAKEYEKTLAELAAILQPPSSAVTDDAGAAAKRAAAKQLLSAFALGLGLRAGSTSGIGTGVMAGVVPGAKPVVQPTVFAWYVLKLPNRRVAGPFVLLDDCQAVATVMAELDATVLSLCRSLAEK
jgi:hypothetical protein